MNRVSMAVGAALLMAGLASWSSPALAQTSESSAEATAEQKATCVNGFEQSQISRRAGRLLAARKQLLDCVQPVCATALQVECTRWLAEVEQQTPTVVISATAAGQDRSYVRVEVDGAVLTELLNGSAIAIDPGSHTFRFVYSDYPVVERTVVLRVGDKLRAVEVSFRRPKSSGAEPTPAPAAPSPLEPVETTRPVPALTYALTGVALAGGGAFAYLGLTAIERRNHLEHVCAPNCSSNDVDPVHARLLAADISLGVGIAALTGAVISYLARPSVPVQRAVSGDVNVTPDGVRASAVLRF